MKNILVLASVIILVFSCVTVSAGELNDPVRDAVDVAIAKVKPALVRIHVVEYYFSQGREIKYEISGSGAIITPEGHVITNHHVAGNSRRVFCTLSNRRKIEAELIGTDPLSDIAVLKLIGEDGEIFPTAGWGDSDLLRVGDRVLSMGSPRALSQSVTLGIVSNTEMVMPRFSAFSKFTIEGEDVGSIVRWIAHDAEIHGGNSGGPLVNLKGEIVGINEIKVGLAGAIPGNLAREVAESLMKTGSYQRSWMGLEVQPLLKGSKHKTGVLVSGTLKDSPAEAAGFEPGDILLNLNGVDVRVRFDEELPPFNLLRTRLPIGEKVSAVVLRQGKEKTLSVQPVERQPVRAEGRELPEWGLTARNVSLIAARELRRENTLGVLVTGVRPGGPSREAKPPLRSRDVIIEVNGLAIDNLNSLETLTRSIISESNEETVPVMVAFERHSEHHLTVVKIGMKEWQDPGLELRKAWMGIGFQVLTEDLAEALDLDGKQGVRITRVYPGGAADKADLRTGDILLSLDGESIATSRPEESEIFSSMVRQYKIGTEAECRLIRGGEEMTVMMPFGASPKLARELSSYTDTTFDFTARDMAFLDRMRQHLPMDLPGAWVESVPEGGWAALARLSVGDVILSIDGDAVSDVHSLESLMKELADTKPERVVLYVRRGIHTLFLEIEPRWEEE